MAGWQLQIAIPKCLGFRIINPQWKLANTINNKLYYIKDNVLPFSDHIRDLGIYHDTRSKYDQFYITYRSQSLYSCSSYLEVFSFSRSIYFNASFLCIHVR